MYELKCTCNSTYFGETKKKKTWKQNGTILEQQNILSHVTDNLIGIHPNTMAGENDFRKRKTREAIEINTWTQQLTNIKEI